KIHPKASTSSSPIRKNSCERVLTSPIRRAHSAPPSMTTMPNRTATPAVGISQITASARGASTRAVKTRLSTLQLLQLLRRAPEPALPAGEIGKGLRQFRRTEIRPQHVGEIKFGISKLPKQEITDAA